MADLIVHPNGGLEYDGHFVGEFNDGKLVVNLAWCRLAGVSVRVDGDPSVEKRRVVVDRPVE